MTSLATIQTGQGINAASPFLWVKWARPNCMGSGSRVLVVSRRGSGLLGGKLRGVAETRRKDTWDFGILAVVHSNGEGDELVQVLRFLTGD